MSGQVETGSRKGIIARHARIVSLRRRREACEGVSFLDPKVIDGGVRVGYDGAKVEVKLAYEQREHAIPKRHTHAPPQHHAAALRAA